MDEYVGQRRRYYDGEGKRDDTQEAFTVKRKRGADEMFAGQYDLQDDSNDSVWSSGIASARDLEKYTYLVEED